MNVRENYVVCVHPEPVEELGRVREKLEAGDGFVSSSASRMAHAVLDAVVDEYLPIMDALRPGPTRSRQSCSGAMRMTPYGRSTTCSASNTCSPRYGG